MYINAIFPLGASMRPSDSAELIPLSQRLTTAAASAAPGAEGDTKPTPHSDIDVKPTPQPGFSDEVVTEVTDELARYAFEHKDASVKELSDELDRLLREKAPFETVSLALKQTVVGNALNQLNELPDNQDWGHTGMGRLRGSLQAQGMFNQAMMQKVIDPDATANDW